MSCRPLTFVSCTLPTHLPIKFSNRGHPCRSSGSAGLDVEECKTQGRVDEQERRKNRTKARVRSKVEWPFRTLKRVFGYTKDRYRGLKKNHEWLLAAFALVNLYQHRKRLAPLGT